MNPESDELLCESGQPVVVPFGISEVHRDGLAFDITKLAETFSKGFNEPGRRTLGRENADSVHHLLPHDDERRHEGPGEQRQQEEAAVHVGTVTPSSSCRHQPCSIQSHALLVSASVRRETRGTPTI